MAYTRTTWVDNSSPYITAANLNKIETALVAHDMVVNVKDPAYGATGNGSTDDTTAIQNALNAGGITFFPAGTYLTAQLTIPHAAVLRGVNSGTYNNTFTASQVSIIKLKNSTNATHINIPITSNRVLISDLQFDGNDTNQTAGSWNGINFAADSVANETQAVIERVYTHDYRGTGIKVDGWRQAVHMRDVVSNFNGEHGIQLTGTDCIVDNPICGDNVAVGIVVSGNVTVVKGGAIYNNERGIEVTSGIKRVVLLANGVDRNLRAGVIVATTCAGVSIVGNKFTSNGRQTDNTYPHIDIQTTTGFVTLTGNSFSPLEPGVTNNTNYAVQLASGASAYDTGNNYEGGSDGGYTNAPERLYSNTQPSFREAQTLWTSAGTAAVAEQGLDLLLALTELDATFAGTRRTLAVTEGGREVQISVRGRKITSTAASTVVVSIRDTSNTANVLATVSIVTTNTAGSNWEGVSTWAATPAWFTGAASKNVAVYTSGGNGADDWVFRDITLKWRG